MDPNQQTPQGAPTPETNPVPPVASPTPSQPLVGSPAAQQTPPAASPPPPVEHGTSKTRSIIAILLLIFFYLIGVIYVFLFTKWPKWAKILTLLPLILGIGAVILSVVLIAFYPAGIFNKSDKVRTGNSAVTGIYSHANNTKRQNDVTQILNAIENYAADNQGNLPAGITGTVAIIGDGSGQVDICKYLVPTYIPALNTDPSLNTADVTVCKNYNIGYTVVKNANGTVTVSAPNSEGKQVISITR